MSICIQGPAITIPPLPGGFTLAPPALPVVPGIPELCCKLPPVPIVLPPIPIPPIVFNSAIVAALNAYITTALSYINSLPLECPLE